MGPGLTPRPREKSEGEKPFWISYADLMTSLMILFLVVMVTSLLVVTNGIRQEAQKTAQRRQDIEDVCKELKGKIETDSLSAVRVDCENNRIDFGEAGRFPFGKYQMVDDSRLYDVVGEVIRVSNGPDAKQWLKRVVVEGYADTVGSYLENLDLSLKRSHWVMCRLLSGGSKLDSAQRQEVRQLFMIGGVSFNSPKGDLDASRRVELKLEFYGQTEAHEIVRIPGMTENDRCRLPE